MAVHKQHGLDRLHIALFMQLAFYISLPQELIDVSPLVPAGASAVSGFCAAACSLPFDYIKTQIQKMQPDAMGKYPYTGSWDCAFKTLRTGGATKFYAGFPVYCVRIAPHVMVSLRDAIFRLYISCLYIFLVDLWMEILQMVWIFLNQIQKFQKSIGL